MITDVVCAVAAATVACGHCIMCPVSCDDSGKGVVAHCVNCTVLPVTGRRAVQHAFTCLIRVALPGACCCCC